MTDTHSLIIKTLAKGATAQLRLLIKDAPREDARVIYDELKGIAAELANKHNFVSGGTHVKREKSMSLR